MSVYDDYLPVLTEVMINERLEDMAANIWINFKPEVVIGVLKGGCPMTVDLTRKLARHNLFPEIHYVELKRKAHRGTWLIDNKYWPIGKEDLKGKRVLVVDDVLDSGTTILHMLDVCKFLYQVADVKVAVAVDKGLPNAHAKGLQADWALLYNERRWLIGYGMDDEAGLYRNLPGIWAASAPST